MLLRRLILVAFVPAGALIAAAAVAAPGVDEALKYTPVQDGVEYDIPTSDEAKECKISAEKIGGATGWVVRGAGGAILREFVDSNSDNIVDTWSYYRGGLEVYRDIDANFNRKADQYRWFHTGGSRWGARPERRRQDRLVEARSAPRKLRKKRWKPFARKTRPDSPGCS